MKYENNTLVIILTIKGLLNSRLNFLWFRWSDLYFLNSKSLLYLNGSHVGESHLFNSLECGLAHCAPQTLERLIGQNPDCTHACARHWKRKEGYINFEAIFDRYSNCNVVSSLWLMTSSKEGALKSRLEFCQVPICATKIWSIYYWPVDSLTCLNRHTHRIGKHDGILVY